MEFLLLYIGGLLLLLVSISSTLNRVLAAKYSSSRLNKILWHSEVFIFILYWISLLNGGFTILSRILLLLGCLLALLKRRQHLLKTLEATLEGITYITILAFILLDAESAWLISVSMIIISVNAGLNKLNSKLWTNYSENNGLIHFLTTPWLARKWVRLGTQRLAMRSKRFLKLISVCSIATPWMQISGVLLLSAKLLVLPEIYILFIAIQFIIAIGIFLVCDLKYIPHLYCFLITCFAILPVPNWNSYLSVTSAVGIAHVCVTVYFFLFCFSSLTPHSRPGSWLYAFRKNTMMLTFSAAPQRLFSERDLVNMITFAIVSRKTDSSFGVPFSDLGLKSDPHLFISACKPFCVCYPLSEFCGLTFNEKFDSSPRYLSSSHGAICRSIFMSLRGSTLDLFQHCYNSGNYCYDSKKVATIFIPKNIGEDEVDKSIVLEKCSSVNALGRLLHYN